MGKFSLIKLSNFSDCHSSHDPAPWFESCIRSQCSLSNNEPVELNDDFLCDILSVYAQVCSKSMSGRLGQWRSETLCPKTCPKRFIYDECTTLCPATCQSPQPNQVNNKVLS